jgi:archaellum component FlaC
MDTNYPDRNTRIEMMRERLNQLGQELPRTHPLVVGLSQQLDELLNEAQQEMKGVKPFRRGRRS